MILRDRKILTPCVWIDTVLTENAPGLSVFREMVALHDDMVTMSRTCRSRFFTAAFRSFSRNIVRP